MRVGKRDRCVAPRADACSHFRTDTATVYSPSAPKGRDETRGTVTTPLAASYADLPNSRAGCNADDLSSLTSLAPSDKDGNVVLKLASRGEPVARLLPLEQTLMCPSALLPLSQLWIYITCAVWLPGNRKLWPASVVAIGIFGRYTYTSGRM